VSTRLSGVLCLANCAFGCGARRGEAVVASTDSTADDSCWAKAGAAVVWEGFRLAAREGLRLIGRHALPAGAHGDAAVHVQLVRGERRAASAISRS
jgi:hypothetical protein